MINDRKHFKKNSMPLEEFNYVMDNQPMEEVDDEIDELSPTSSCHTLH